MIDTINWGVTCTPSINWAIPSATLFAALVAIAAIFVNSKNVAKQIAEQRRQHTVDLKLDKFANFVLKASETIAEREQIYVHRNAGNVETNSSVRDAKRRMLDADRDTQNLLEEIGLIEGYDADLYTMAKAIKREIKKLDEEDRRSHEEIQNMLTDFALEVREALGLRNE